MDAEPDSLTRTDQTVGEIAIMEAVPLASHEVRWFLPGASTDHPRIKEWFWKVDPFQRGKVPEPEWKERLEEQPDVYLVVPGACDLGIKWREGELQVKGRIADLGVLVFGGRHQGRVEKWTKWSYAGLPDAYKALFTSSQCVTARVNKKRAIRKVRLDTMTSQASEVERRTFVDRGLNIELADVQVEGQAFLSLAFEAFPDDSAMHAAFRRAVEEFLREYPEGNLDPERSESYPAWLARTAAERKDARNKVVALAATQGGRVSGRAIREQEAPIFEAPGQKIFELFRSVVPELGLATAAIEGRIPAVADGNWLINDRVEEFYYVTRGTGRLEFADGASVALEPGTAAHIPKGVGFRVVEARNLHVVVPTSPAWTPEQHRTIR